VAERAVIALCAFALLGTAVGVVASPSAAADLSGAIASVRYGQLQAESLMRYYDDSLGAVKRDLKATRRELQRARRTLKLSRSTLARRAALLEARRARLAQAEADYAAALAAAEEPPPDGSGDPTAEPSPTPDPTLDELAALVSAARKSVRDMQARKAKARRQVRAATRAVANKRARVRYLKRLRSSTIARRESAEAVLGARILEMTDLAAGRVEKQASVSYAQRTAFSWPTPGRIVQTYGCTGYHENPRRGSCAHFHDGVDIVNAHGTTIRSIGVGVVAYAGWNPWDKGRRAWIIVVVHPDGWVSRYGHLTPTSHARVGEVVYTGQIIGRMGNTGNSNGTHLHFELLRGRADVNPLSYMPAGVIRIDKTTTKKGKAKANAKVRRQKAKVRAARARKQARRQARAEAEAQAQVLAAAIEACEPALWSGQPTDDVHAVSYMTDQIDTGACAAPGEPLGQPPWAELHMKRAGLATRLAGGAEPTLSLAVGVHEGPFGPA
jgi:murein DD-endopeptidase MepM/ murein hydrolase activator NlpD